MRENVEIGQFAARYRLRPSQFGERRRLDALMREVTNDAMEPALERAGIRRGEIVCIRSVSVPVRLRLSRPDSALIAEWARMLAEAIADAAESGEVVRYASRAVALIEMGGAIAEGRLQAVWVWRQIGLWRRTQSAASPAAAAEEFVAALLREPESIVAVLSTLARKRQLHVLAPHLEQAWESIVAAVLLAAGISFAEVVEVARPVEVQSDEALRVAVRRAAGAVESSQILRDLVGFKGGDRAAFAIAGLAVLECEPAIVLAPRGELREAAIVVQRLALGAERRIVTQQQQQPERRRTPAEAESRQTGAPDVEYRTAFGGLLFLLRTVDELRIPERALAAPLDRAGENACPTLLARSFTWFLHRLALALQPLDETDPAALAFCGVAPNAPSPSRGEPLPTIDERRLIDTFAEEIRRSAAAALPEPPRPPEALMHFICRRHARVVADPGWIELRFALQDVSTEIRRAGLDLDPNYVPWLGVVVRFVYE